MSAEVIYSEENIDPRRDEGYLIVKIGEINAVANGKRTASMLWGNVNPGVAEAPTNSQIYGRQNGAWKGNLIPLPITANSDNTITELGHTHKHDGIVIKPDDPIVIIKPGTPEAIADDCIVTGLGVLYNSFVALGSGSNSLTSSDDWRIALASDWNGLPDSGLKDLPEFWNTPNSDTGIAPIGLNLRGSGSRPIYGYTPGVCADLKEACLFLCSELISGEVWMAYASHDLAAIEVINTIDEFQTGAAIRLVRTSTALTKGQKGKYTGNNGVIYPTIGVEVAGGVIQEWLACNLQETELRDHTEIERVTDNNVWVHRSTLARCEYDNDVANVGTITFSPGSKNIVTGGSITIPTVISDLPNDSGFATLESPTFTGTVTVPTPVTSANNTQAASTAYVVAKIAEIFAGSPELLDTFAEIRAAFNNDPDFYTTVANAIGAKLNRNFDNISDAAAARTALGLGALAVLSNLAITEITGLTDALAGKEPAFNKNAAFNKNFGATSGTVLEGRTFGSAANADVSELATVDMYNAILQASYFPTPASLVAYWKLDEASGNTYADSTGTNNGTGNPSPTAVAGLVGGSQQFNGTTTKIDVPANPTFDFAANGNFSVEFWYKGFTLPAEFKSIIGRYSATAGAYWYVGFGTGSGSVRFTLVSGGTNTTVFGSSIIDGNWHHVVATRNGTTGESKIYVDGTIGGTATQLLTADFSSPTSKLEIGSLLDSYLVEGSLDEVAVHNAELTPAEILRHYRIGLIGMSYYS